MSCPPKPALAFRVGVVGHRPDRLKEADLGAIATSLRAVLETVKKEVLDFGRANGGLFREGQPILRAVSPLAEGADRIFADQALDLGYRLCCVMPFPQEVFELDFRGPKSLEEGSIERFKRLLEQAESAFVLDGHRNAAADAYGNAGEVVLNQSDLLIVVWDHHLLGKPGGTEETMMRARRSGVPIVVIDPKSPDDWRVDDKPHEDQRAVLAATVRAALDLPDQGGQSKDHREALERFYAERQPKNNVAILWKAFKGTVGAGKLPKLGIKVDPFEDQIWAAWSGDPLVEELRPYYAWTDKLGDLCADRYRSAYVAIYFLSALAVGAALATLLLPESRQVSTGFAVTELSMIGILLALVVAGRRCAWHERWIDYRLAAEQIRHLRLVSGIGGALPYPNIPAHHAAYGRPRATWMGWYVVAVARQLGLPSRTLDKSGLTEALSASEDLLQKQVEFHGQNQATTHALEHRLHVVTVVCLVLTVVACLWHLVFAEEYGRWPMFVCAFLPAVGTAMQGLSNQAELRRVAKRSKAMKHEIEGLLKESSNLRALIDSQSGESHYRDVRRLLEDEARLLLQEVLDWRVVFLDRPLEHA